MKFNSNTEMPSRRTVDLVTANLEPQSKDYLNEVQLRALDAKAKKYMWFLLVKVLIVTSLIAIYKTWQEFHLTPIFRNIDLDIKEQAIDFPSVFICPKDPVDYGKLEMFLDEMNMNVNDSRGIIAECLVNLVQFSTERTFSNGSCTGLEEQFAGLKIEDVLNQVLITCEDYIFNCTFKGHPIECCSNIIPMRTEKGQCFVFNNFNINFNSSSHQIWSYEEDWKFAFNLHEPQDTIDIYLKGFYDTLSFSEFVDFRWQPNHISFIDMNIFQNVSTSDIRVLTLNQRQCLFSDERGPFRKLHGTGYNYDICLNECHLQAFSKACGCVPLCYQDIALLGKEGIPHCNVTRSVCVRDNLKKVNLRSCNCPKECDLIIYYIDVVHEKKFKRTDSVPRKIDETSDFTKNHVTLDLKAWPVKRFKNQLSFGWDELSLPLGGIAGIFLGFSFLSTLELIYRILFRFCWALLIALIGFLKRFLRFRKKSSDLIPMDPINSISQITRKKNKVEHFSEMDTCHGN